MGSLAKAVSFYHESHRTHDALPERLALGQSLATLRSDAIHHPRPASGGRPLLNAAGPTSLYLTDRAWAVSRAIHPETVLP